jgi:hypothetical protein
LERRRRTLAANLHNDLGSFCFVLRGKQKRKSLDLNIARKIWRRGEKFEFFVVKGGFLGKKK